MRVPLLGTLKHIYYWEEQAFRPHNFLYSPTQSTSILIRINRGHTICIFTVSLKIGQQAGIAHSVETV